MPLNRLSACLYVDGGVIIGIQIRSLPSAARRAVIWSFVPHTLTRSSLQLYPHTYTILQAIKNPILYTQDALFVSTTYDTQFSILAQSCKNQIAGDVKRNSSCSCQRISNCVPNQQSTIQVWCAASPSAKD